MPVYHLPQTARILDNGTERVVAAEQVKVNDILRVLPGETIPVDGVITAGQTSVNQAVMTGESIPVDKTIGDEVSSGTVNQFGACNTNCNNGSHWKCHKAWVSCKRGRRVGEACGCF